MRRSASKENASVRRQRPFFESLEDRRLFAGFTVDLSHPVSANNFHTIQSAVDAVTSPNTTINVASGTYSEQVLIPSASKYNGLQINGQDNSTIIQAPTTPLTSSGAIVEISGAQNVSIVHVTIRGSASAGVAGLQYGVLVDGGASATISHDTITDIRQDPADLGNTVGYGVGVTSGTAAVDHTTITEYQRGGILVAPTSIGASGPATSPIPSATITQDTIDGSLSPTQTIHNGIVFLDGATGSIDHTTVTGNVNTIVVGPSFFACDGILLENSGVVSVTQDTLTHNDTNLVIDALDFGGDSFYGSRQIQVSHLMINNATYDGIDVLDGATGITIDHVTSDNNGWSGLFFDSFSGGNTVNQSEFKSNDQSGLGFANIEDDTPGSGGTSSGAPHFGTLNSYDKVKLNDGMLSKTSPSSDFFDPNG